MRAAVAPKTDSLGPWFLPWYKQPVCENCMMVNLYDKMKQS